MGQKDGFQLMVAGLGGQGALFIGRLLAEAALANYRNANFFPNYGPAMRLGPSECTVTVSDEDISSPVALNPEAAIIMGAASLADFEGRMKPDSMMILDGSVLRPTSKKRNVNMFYIPATKAATKLGNMAVTNLVLLGAYLETNKAVPIEAVETALDKRMAGGQKAEMLSLNKAALKEGARLMAEHPKPKKKRSLAPADRVSATRTDAPWQ